MTIQDIYRMTLGDELKLRKQIENSGELLNEVWDAEHYTHNKIFRYEGNDFEINSILGILAVDNKRIGLI